jgi:ubiquinone/menaquinone biosynthesis C-methylase UbiE
VKDRYSFVAPYYDFLAKLVFGNDLKDLKTQFITNLNQKKILIIGGGDGLDYREFQSGLSGEYWEISEAMLRKAKKNLTQSKLTFHLGDFKSNPENQFDEIWLHFVLDTFLDTELEQFLLEIKKSLRPNSKIYIADFFNPQTPVQKVFHAAMLGYFRIITQHLRTDVPDYELAFQKAGFQKLDEIRKRKGWIRAQLWESAAN